MINLLLPCILTLIITLFLYKNTNNKIDLNILKMMLFGQLLLIIGSIIKNNYIIEISHILFILTISLGILFFKTKHNLLFVLICLLITLLTRLYFDDCLFLMSNNHTQIFSLNINFDYIFYLEIIIGIYRYINL